MVFLWSASSFNSYMIAFQLKYIQGNVFSNTLAAGLSEAPTVFISGLLYQSLGLKATLVLCFLFSLVGSISLLVFKAYVSLIPIMIFAARAGVAASFSICYLANAQIFPTSIAGTAFSVCNVFAKLVTIMAPLSAEIQGDLPTIIFTVFSALAAIFSLLLRLEKN